MYVSIDKWEWEWTEFFFQYIQSQIKIRENRLTTEEGNLKNEEIPSFKNYFESNEFPKETMAWGNVKQSSYEIKQKKCEPNLWIFSLAVFYITIKIPQDPWGYIWFQLEHLDGHNSNPHNALNHATSAKKKKSARLGVHRDSAHRSTMKKENRSLLFLKKVDKEIEPAIRKNENNAQHTFS